ncbi:hypothetical protein E2C01_042668 [Portunus trituberculatus]|uniref:Uncharacterized protein n=1 Tax=Portunus trituberculatus TaxID=210409 RepID=A0A5B7FQU0_PORTR|nr:hypothetical protein [Portunus trituberculatus]
MLPPTALGHTQERRGQHKRPLPQEEERQSDERPRLAAPPRPPRRTGPQAAPALTSLPDEQ